MPGFRLGPLDRVRKRAEFQKIQKHGKRFRAGNFLVNYLLREDRRLRLGITVSSRMKNACSRNRAKRLVREFFRLNREQVAALLQKALGRDTGADLVFVAYPGAEKLNYQEAREELMAGLAKELRRIGEQ